MFKQSVCLPAFITFSNFNAQNYQELGYTIRLLIPAMKQNYVTVIKKQNPL